MIDAYLAKDSLSICLPDRMDQDKRYHFKHPERIITTENFEEISKELYPYFLISMRDRRHMLWDSEEVTSAISCALYLHYVASLHRADIDERESVIQ